MLRRTPLRRAKPLQARKPMARTAMKPKPRKRASTAERRHLDRVARMGCLVCGAPCEVHHITSDGAARITRTHERVAPLCSVHHRTGRDAVHAIGQRRFNEVHGLDLLAWADAAWADTQER